MTLRASYGRGKATAFIAVGLALGLLIMSGAAGAEDRPWSSDTLWFVDSACFTMNKIRDLDIAEDSAVNRARQKILGRGGVDYWNAEVTAIFRGDDYGGRRDRGSVSISYAQPKWREFDWMPVRRPWTRDIERAGSPGQRGGFDEQHCVMIRMGLVRDTTLPDPDLVLKVTLSPSHLAEGAVMPIEVWASQDCYLTLFALEKDQSMSLLFPDEFGTNNRIPANRTVPIPGPEAGWVLDARLAEGQTISEEILIAVATKVKGRFVPTSEAFRKHDLMAVDNGLEEFSRWLGKFPYNQRVVVMSPYTIFKE